MRVLKDKINKDMRTGEIEILGTGLEVINKADVLPLDWNQENSEEQRLRYRYLDLRRPQRPAQGNGRKHV